MRRSRSCPTRAAGRRARPWGIVKTKGAKLTLLATGAGSGALRVLVGGALCQTLAVDARPERNRGGSDAVVAAKGRADYRTLASAVANAVDRDGDGRVTITVGDGVYRESVELTRAVEIFGAGDGRSIVDARGLGSAFTFASAGAVVRGVTASGGTTGVTVAVPMTVSGLDARGNVGPGIALAAPGAVATACSAYENGGAGFSVAAPASVVASSAFDNAGAGVAVTAPASGVVVRGNVLGSNALDGVAVVLGSAPVVADNAIAGNYGGGVSLEETAGGTIAGNRAAANDGDGLSLGKSNGALVDGNDFSANHGFGIRSDRSVADYDAATGTQGPPGTNDVRDDRKGAIDVR